MKNLYFLVLLITGTVGAQDVFIPDPNFKAKLIAVGVDSNMDGEIQVVEAEETMGLFIADSNISDLTGISAFINIGDLDCSGNSISELDLSMQSQLFSLDVSDNPMTMLVLNNTSPLFQIQLNSTLINMLDLSGLANLQQIFANNTAVMDLNLTGCTGLVAIQMNNSMLGFIDVSTCTSLTQAFLNNNSLTGIELGTSTTLHTLHLDNNQLFSINVTGLPSLNTLFCQNNNLSSIDLSNSVGLEWLAISSNDLNTIDVSNSPSLTVFNCSNNIFLQTIFMKNGAIEGSFAIDNNSNLQFICADDAQVQAVQAIAGPTVVVNSYCTFVPGGDYNTITGTVRFDENNNGCDAADIPNEFIKIGITSGSTSGAAYTTTTGQYNFYVQNGSFAIAPITEHPSYFTVSPASANLNFPLVDNSTIMQNFCLAPNGIQNDAKIVIVPITPAQPGFEAVYQIFYKNKGNQTLSGQISFTYPEAVLNYLSATVTPNATAAGVVTWNYSNLKPFENRSIYVTLDVNSPTDTPPVVIDDVLNYDAAIALTTGTETTPLDNVFSYDETVIGSYDPNDKICIQGEVVSPSMIGQYLHYTINFENTGTAPAQNIVVRDTIDVTQFDLSSLQVMHSSHPVVARMNGNILECVFQDIALETGGHGNILLKIKTPSSLATGDMVSNVANIFFDYNFPVETNMANTTFQSLSVGENVDASIAVYPNPVNDVVNVTAKSVITSLQLYDIQGRLLQALLNGEQSAKLDLSNKSAGIYFLKITTSEGTRIEKLIKK